MIRSISTDGILIENGKILLIRRAVEPFKGFFALPGGHLESDESAQECAAREFKEETGLYVKPILLLGVYSDPKRDPRSTVTLAYIVKRIRGNLCAGTDAASAQWFDLSALPKLAFDHDRIINDAMALTIKPRR